MNDYRTHVGLGTYSDITYPHVLFQEHVKKVLKSVPHFDGDGSVERRLFRDVPASVGPNNSQAMSFGMKLFHQDLHIDPVAAIYREQENVSSIAGRREESHPCTEENKYSTGATHGSWNVDNSKNGDEGTRDDFSVIIPHITKVFTVMVSYEIKTVQVQYFCQGKKTRVCSCFVDKQHEKSHTLIINNGVNSPMSRSR